MRTYAKLIKMLLLLLILASCLSLSISLFAGSKKIENPAPRPIEYRSEESNPTEEAERREKESQLERVAERFKAETGFRGEIKYNTEKMRLGFIEGKFADIRITADADTVSFRAVFEQILDKVMPYTFAKREQYSRSKIANNLGRIKTVYYQQINGYRVEGAGWLSIVYETGRNSFVIGNTTVELPGGNTNNIITSDEAKLIALTATEDEHYTSAKCLNTFYSSEGSDHYYLAYLVEVSSDDAALYEDILFWIDTSTGLVKKSMISPSIE